MESKVPSQNPQPSERVDAIENMNHSRLDNHSISIPPLSKRQRLETFENGSETFNTYPQSVEEANTSSCQPTRSQKRFCQNVSHSPKQHSDEELQSLPLQESYSGQPSNLHFNTNSTYDERVEPQDAPFVNDQFFTSSNFEFQMNMNSESAYHSNPTSKDVQYEKDCDDDERRWAQKDNSGSKQKHRMDASRYSRGIKNRSAHLTEAPSVGNSARLLENPQVPPYSRVKAPAPGLPEEPFFQNQPHDFQPNSESTFEVSQSKNSIRSFRNAPHATMNSSPTRSSGNAADEWEEEAENSDANSVDSNDASFSWLISANEENGAPKDKLVEHNANAKGRTERNYINADTSFPPSAKHRQPPHGGARQSTMHGEDLSRERRFPPMRENYGQEWRRYPPGRRNISNMNRRGMMGMSDYDNERIMRMNSRFYRGPMQMPIRGHAADGGGYYMPRMFDHEVQQRRPVEEGMMRMNYQDPSTRARPIGMSDDGFRQPMGPAMQSHRMMMGPMGHRNHEMEAFNIRGDDGFSRGSYSGPSRMHQGDRAKPPFLQRKYGPGIMSYPIKNRTESDILDEWLRQELEKATPEILMTELNSIIDFSDISKPECSLTKKKNSTWVTQHCEITEEVYNQLGFFLSMPDTELQGHKSLLQSPTLMLDKSLSTTELLNLFKYEILQRNLEENVEVDLKKYSKSIRTLEPIVSLSNVSYATYRDHLFSCRQNEKASRSHEISKVPRIENNPDDPMTVRLKVVPPQLYDPLLDIPKNQAFTDSANTTSQNQSDLVQSTDVLIDDII